MAPTDPYARLSTDELIRVAQAAEAQYRDRHDVIQGQRDQRYGRTAVLDMIPEPMRYSDFEYHTPDINKSIFDLTSFLSAATLEVRVEAPSDDMTAEANLEEEALRAIFSQDGVLNSLSENEVPFEVWQDQIETGEGRYKFIMAKDYPLHWPVPYYVDSLEEAEGAELEENPEYNPRSRRETRGERQMTRYREPRESVQRRRESYMRQTFPWRWSRVDPQTFFDTKVDETSLLAGEMTMREATVLGDHGLQDLANDKSVIAFYGQGKPTQGFVTGSGSRGYVQTVELWTPTRACFGVVSQTVGENGSRAIYLSKNDEYREWKHPYGRVPYYPAYGMRSTDPSAAYQYSGFFDALFAEAPLLDYLETMVFNATHRQLNPRAQLVRINNDAAPLAAGIQTIVDQETARTSQPPPGYEWREIPGVAPFDLLRQLQAARERLSENAVAAVLTGKGFAADSSGAQVSLVLGAAERAISSAIRHHRRPLKQMMECMLAVNKKLGLTMNVSTTTLDERNRMLVKSVALTPDAIVQHKVDVFMNVRLPVDEAAMESRGLNMLRNGGMSYETVAPKYFGVGDPEKELTRIDFGKRRAQIDEMAFRAALLEWTGQAAPQLGPFVAGIEPPERPAGTIGGGPGGVMGGAVAGLATGGPSRPDATQVDS